MELIDLLNDVGRNRRHWCTHKGLCSPSKVTTLGIPDRSGDVQGGRRLTVSHEQFFLLVNDVSTLSEVFDPELELPYESVVSATTSFAEHDLTERGDLESRCMHVDVVSSSTSQRVSTKERASNTDHRGKTL
jgi:hypothetical protein